MNTIVISSPELPDRLDYKHTYYTTSVGDKKTGRRRRSNSSRTDATNGPTVSCFFWFPNSGGKTEGQGQSKTDGNEGEIYVEGLKSMCHL